MVAAAGCGEAQGLKQRLRHLAQSLGESTHRRWGGDAAGRLVVGGAFQLMAPNDPSAGERSPLAGDHGIRTATAVAHFLINHDPVMGPSQEVGAGGVGIERRVLAFAAPRVEHRKPSFARQVKPPGRDERQTSGGRGFAILTVNLEDLSH